MSPARDVSADQTRRLVSSTGRYRKALTAELTLAVSPHDAAQLTRRAGGRSPRPCRQLATSLLTNPGGTRTHRQRRPTRAKSPRDDAQLARRSGVHSPRPCLRAFVLLAHTGILPRDRLLVCVFHYLSPPNIPLPVSLSLSRTQDGCRVSCPYIASSQHPAESLRVTHLLSPRETDPFRCPCVPCRGSRIVTSALCSWRLADLTFFRLGHWSAQHAFTRLCGPTPAVHARADRGADPRCVIS